MKDRPRWKMSFIRGRNHKFDQARKVWRPKGAGQGQEMGRASDKHQTQLMTVVGHREDEKVEWLQRSLICTSTEPCDLATLSSAILHSFGHFSKLSALSSLKFILTFHSQEEMEAAWSNQTELHQWLVLVKKWDVYECCDFRRVWIDILGVPPHGWKWENFKLIAELWGIFIYLGNSTITAESFESMRVLIATDIFRRIDAELLLHLDHCGYRVFIREVGTVCQAGRAQAHNKQYARMDGEESNNGSISNVPGFDDIGDHFCSHKDDYTTKQGQGEEEGSPQSQINLNSNLNSNCAEGEGAELVEFNARDQVEEERSRTRTVSFSHNGYSAEVIKEAQHLRKAANGEYGESRGLEDLNLGMSSVQSSDLELSEPPGFEKDHQKIMAHQDQDQPVLLSEKGGNSSISNNSRDKIMAAERSSEPTNKAIVSPARCVTDSDGILAPPEFELNQPVVQPRRSSQSLKAKEQKRQHEGLGLRLTRSQAKKMQDFIDQKSSIKGKYGNREISPQSNNSLETTESMTKLALESIELGELLGLKVIDKKEVALKQITSSLKKGRKARAAHLSK